MPKLTEPHRVHMTAEQLCSNLERIFGEAYQVKFARLTGVSKSQVNRYANSLSPIPKRIAVLIAALKALRNHKLPLPDPKPVLRRARARPRS